METFDQIIIFSSLDSIFGERTDSVGVCKTRCSSYQFGNRGTGIDCRAAFFFFLAALRQFE